jgi:hypothetical protein
MKVPVRQLLTYAPLPVWNELRVTVGMTVIDEQDSLIIATQYRQAIPSSKFALSSIKISRRSHAMVWLQATARRISNAWMVEQHSSVVARLSGWFEM